MYVPEEMHFACSNHSRGAIDCLWMHTEALEPNGRHKAPEIGRIRIFLMEACSSQLREVKDQSKMSVPRPQTVSRTRMSCNLTSCSHFLPTLNRIYWVSLASMQLR
jgi:hypothetical protein